MAVEGFVAYNHEPRPKPAWTASLLCRTSPGRGVALNTDPQVGLGWSLSLFNLNQRQSTTFLDFRFDAPQFLYIICGAVSMGSVESEPHCISLPKLSCRLDHPHISATVLNEAAQQWLQKFNKIINQDNVSDLATIVHRDAWLRDMLALTWDFRALNGSEKIASYVQENCKSAGLRSIQLRTSGTYLPRIKQPAPDIEWLEAMFDFETTVGAGSGMLRLVVDDDGEWKLFMINFMLQKLKGFDETTHLNRPSGGNNSLDGAGNWFEQRQRQKEFLDDDPAVVIIGAGKFHGNMIYSLSEADA